MLIDLTLESVKWNQMDLLGSIWFHFTLKSYRFKGPFGYQLSIFSWGLSGTPSWSFDKLPHNVTYNLYYFTVVYI